jgi:hypothetical protein
VLVISAGVEQSEDMKRFLWCVDFGCGGWGLLDLFLGVYRDNHFAAVAGDQPAFEVHLASFHHLTSSEADDHSRAGLPPRAYLICIR